MLFVSEREQNGCEVVGYSIVAQKVGCYPRVHFPSWLYNFKSKKRKHKVRP